MLFQSSKKPKRTTNKEITAAYVSSAIKERTGYELPFSSTTLTDVPSPIKDQADNETPACSTPLKAEQRTNRFNPFNSALNNKENKSHSNFNLSPTSNEKQLEDKLRSAEAEVKYWKGKYNELVNTQDYPLTEKTGKELVNLLNQLSNI